MAITYVGAGTAVQTVTTSLALTAPETLSNDLLIAVIISRNNTAVAALAGWTVIRDTANTSAMQTYVAWKRAGTGTEAHTFTVAGTTTSFGVIVAYRGVTLTGNPVYQSSISNNASADNVTFATFTTAGINHVVGIGTYADDETTSGTFSGTNPTMTERVDVENITDEDASIFIWDGPILTQDVAFGARTLDTASVVDAVNQGIAIELIDRPVPNAGRLGDAVVNYPRNTRIR
mgnify:CR=1 FL=1